MHSTPAISLGEGGCKIFRRTLSLRRWKQGQPLGNRTSPSCFLPPLVEHTNIGRNARNALCSVCVLLLRRKLLTVCLFSRTWRRWGPLGTIWSQSDDHSSRGTAGDSSDSNGEGEDGGDEGHGWSLVSPVCSRCRYLTAHPLTPPPPTAETIGTCSSRSLSSSASTATATATATNEADVTLGRYCLCTVNREIQLEVLQVGVLLRVRIT